ncbi:MAG: G8 domain-containing protein [Verrucomicrobiales bacterium]
MNCVPLSAALLAICAGLCPAADAPHAAASSAAPRYEAESAASGAWSAPATWKDGRVPGGGDRVLVASGHRVIYDVSSREVIHSIRVPGR